jgi:hypothetical protein
MARGRVIPPRIARLRFGQLMRQVVDNREVAVVEREAKHRWSFYLAQYERLLAERRKQGGWTHLVQRARQQIKSEIGGRQLTPSEDVLRELRAERDAGLTGLR